MKNWKKLIKWWDRGIGSGEGRKFSLLIVAIWLYTCLLIGLFNKTVWYYATIIGIFALALDNHNLKRIK